MIYVDPDKMPYSAASNLGLHFAQACPSQYLGQYLGQIWLKCDFFHKENDSIHLFYLQLTSFILGLGITDVQRDSAFQLQNQKVIKYPSDYSQN